MMHRARSSIVEVLYCFSRSSVKFQGHTALKILEFDPKWAFPDCNSSLNSAMAMKCCTKLETAKERSPIVFQGHPSNFKVTWYKTSPILTLIGCFRTIGQSQLSNPSDLPCLPGANFGLLLLSLPTSVCVCINPEFVHVITFRARITKIWSRKVKNMLIKIIRVLVFDWPWISRLNFI